MADYDKLLQVPRGTKARLEEIKLDLLVNTLVYATDTKELGIKLSDGNIEYFMNATDINASIPTNVSQLNNDSGYITGYTETDPIFTAWNKSTGISITKSQVSDLIEATQALSGLMSATDKQRLDVLHALLEEDTENNVVDSINEVLAIFNNYPEGADLVTALAGKVDKVAGMGLSTEDYTTTEKTKLTGIQAGAQVNTVTSVASKTGAIVLTQDDIGDGSTYKRVSQTEKNTWNNKQDKLVAGVNINIDENNVIEVDLNEMSYFDYAGSVYGDKYSLLASAWEHSLTVDTLEISENSSYSNSRGTAQYPNGETKGVIIPQGVTTIGDYAFLNWKANNQPLVIPDSVTSIGHYAFWDWKSNNQPLIIPNSVTSIGEAAFSGWSSNNQPLVIPQGVKSIGEAAFSGWSSNNQPFVIPSSVTSIGFAAFNSWTSNNQPLVIPNSVTSIEDSAFQNWSLVPYVEMQAITPPTLANADAFDGQDDAPIYVPNDSVEAYKTATNWVDLASRIFPISDMIVDSVLSDRVDNLETSKQDKLVAGNNITIDENTNVISASGGGGDGIDLNMLGYMNYAADIFYRARRQSLFSNAWESSLAVDPLEISEDSSFFGSVRGKEQYPNGEIEGVIIPQGVTSIGTYAFSNWEANNQPLVIPNSVTSIGDNAFSSWKSNNQPLVIPESVTSIRTTAFSNWEANNQPLVIPSSVTSIGNYAFQNWSVNTHPLVIPDSVTSIGTSAFYNWQSNNHPLVIPNSVTGIGGAAFRDWNSNTHPLVIPNSVTSIGNNTFRDWRANTHPLVIPNSVTSIGDNAFYDWTANNQPLVIPDSVTSIGTSAFYNWEAVPHVEIQAITPPTLTNAKAFNGQNDAPIYVPDESVDDYKTATNWVNLASRIFSINDK